MVTAELTNHLQKGQTMSEQQSQKSGVRSEAQKMERAREGYETIPPAQPVAGAFGEHKSDTATDQDVALRLNEKHAREKRDNEQREE
jgi:hypothetical protein